MRIVTTQTNPWNDDKEHIRIPLHRYGDDFFIYELSDGEEGEFPVQLNGATYGQVYFLLKNEFAVERMIGRLDQIQETLRLTLKGLEEKRRIERKELPDAEL